MRLLTSLLLLLTITTLSAQQKPPPPVAIFAYPFAIEPGKTTKVTVRGQRLEDAKELRVQHPQVTGKLIGNLKKVNPPNQVPASRIGDHEIDIELTLPREVAGDFVPFAIIGPGGESKPARVLVIDGTPRLAEKEPNDGFRNAQAITTPIAIDGVIERDRDVDVFRFEGKAGQRVDIELQSGRWGVPLDGLLTVYDAGGRVLAIDDDGLAPDAKISLTLPTDGTYLISLIDTFDQGGPTYRYRLLVR